MADELWHALQIAFRVTGRVVGLLRKIPFIDDSVDRLQGKWLNPVITKQVRSPDDVDLDAALELYRKKIPNDQQFEAADIVRWLREGYESRNSGGPSDWFIVAKYRRKVCGFILLHYYPSAQLAFFAYMVSSNTPGVPVNAVSRSLATRISNLLKSQKQLRNYRGFVMEVEDPRKETGKSKRDEGLARVRRFCTLAEMQGFTLRALEMDYKQPKLSLDPASTERPMLLLSARRRGTNSEPGDYRAEVEEILNFVYTKVYPEGFSPDPEENREYRAYCADLLARQISALPSHIRSLGCSELAAQLGRKKSRLPVHE